MTAARDYDEPLDYAGLADVLGIQPASLLRTRLRNPDTFPKPYRVYGRTPVWRPSAVIEWYKTKPSQRAAQSDLRASKRRPQ